MRNEVHGYDSADRHIISKLPGGAVEYVRDATDRIVTRKLSGVISAKYAYTASADSPSLTLNSAGTVTERTISLPGGVVVTARGTTASDVWSYPNIHGDIVATANGAGTKAGATRGYDPFGNLLGTSTTPDNSAGPFDYGWHGSAQRPLEYSSGFTPLIEMGARQYSSLLGRFLQVDPVAGGNLNPYMYVHDPVNSSDLDGKCGTWGNPWRRCRNSKRKRRGFLGGAFSKSQNSMVRHRGMLATIGASAGCLIPAVGLAACAGLQAAAWGVRSQQRGYRKFRNNSLDAGVTVMFFGLVNVPAGLGTASMTNVQKFWANLGVSSVSDGPQIGGCLASRQATRGC
jgi:RHS repeat-associated protein